MVSRSLQGLTIESLLIVHTVLSPLQPALGSFFYHQIPIHIQLEALHSKAPEYWMVVHYAIFPTCLENSVDCTLPLYLYSHSNLL